MTSSNLPDAIEKLAAVLAESSQAASLVFSLSERQHQLLHRGEDILNQLDEISKRRAPSRHDVTQLVSECRSVHEEIGTVTHQIVLAQEFQDLTGQKIRKVRDVLQDIDNALRVLLEQFNVDIPPAAPSADSDIDQATADAILKELGV
jgi:chemotaxis regulatin CheY-phosphate phosphatase CheZ